MPTGAARREGLPLSSDSLLWISVPASTLVNDLQRRNERVLEAVVSLLERGTPAQELFSADAETLDRARRLFERLVDVAYPIRRGGRTIHQLNNGLAGLAANIELMELLVADAASGLLDEPQRQELSTAIAFALEACSALKTTIRALSGLAGTHRPPTEVETTGPAPGTSAAGPRSSGRS